LARLKKSGANLCQPTSINNKERCSGNNPISNCEIDLRRSVHFWFPIRLDRHCRILDLLAVYLPRFHVLLKQPQKEGKDLSSLFISLQRTFAY
jgi:hypothetical protein